MLKSGRKSGLDPSSLGFLVSAMNTQKSGSSQLSFNDQKLDINDQKVQNYLSKEVQKNKKNFDQKLRNVKPIVMNEAVEWI